VLGAFTLARPVTRPYQRMAVHMAIMASATAVFALSGVLWVSLGAIGLAGFSYLVCHTQASALLYAHVPEAQRGRVMALWTLAFVGTRPLTSLVSGSIADTVGVQVAALVTTIPVFAAAALAFAMHFRDRAGRLPAEVDPAPRPEPKTPRATRARERAAAKAARAAKSKAKVAKSA
jgi:MFS family permease